MVLGYIYISIIEKRTSQFHKRFQMGKTIRLNNALCTKKHNSSRLLLKPKTVEEAKGHTICTLYLQQSNLCVAKKRIICIPICHLCILLAVPQPQVLARQRKHLPAQFSQCTVWENRILTLNIRCIPILVSLILQTRNQRPKAFGFFF